MSRVLQAVDSIHQVGIYCLVLVNPNCLPKTPLGGIHLSEVLKSIILKWSMYSCSSSISYTYCALILLDKATFLRRYLAPCKCTAMSSYLRYKSTKASWNSFRCWTCKCNGRKHSSRESSGFCSRPWFRSSWWGFRYSKEGILTHFFHIKVLFWRHFYQIYFFSSTSLYLKSWNGDRRQRQIT